MSFEVFISYATEDMRLVEQIRQVLISSSIDVFVAEHCVLPGQSLSSEIITAIKSCDLFVLLWSRYSQSSEWVPQEIGIARAGDKPIVPLLLEPGLQPPGFIRDVKYLSIHDGPEDSLAWLRQHALERKQTKQTADFWKLLVVLGVLYLCCRK